MVSVPAHVLASATLELPLVGPQDRVVAVTVRADRVIQNHPAVGPAPAVPLLHEVVIDFALNMSAVTALTETLNLGTAEEPVGRGNVELIVAMSERITVTIGAADARLFVPG